MERSSYCRIVTVRHALSSFTSRFSFSPAPSQAGPFIGLMTKYMFVTLGGFAFPFNCPWIQHTYNNSQPMRHPRCGLPPHLELFSFFLFGEVTAIPIACFITRVPRSSPRVCHWPRRASRVTARHQACTTPIIDRDHHQPCCMTVQLEAL